MRKEAEKECDSSLLEGALSVFSVLETGSRKIECLYLRENIDEKDRKIAALLKKCRAASVPITYRDAAFFDSRALGTSHGGVMAAVGERSMLSVEAMLKKKQAFYVYLCGIEDPYNFGYAVRSLYAAGADGIFVTPRNWLSAAGVCVRASAGATERMPFAEVEDDEALCGLAKKRGYRVVAAEQAEDALPHTSADLHRPILLIIGGEKRGIPARLLSCCDHKVVIAYGRAVEQSLSAAAASAVLGFEVLRQNPAAEENG